MFEIRTRHQSAPWLFSSRFTIYDFDSVWTCPEKISEKCLIRSGEIPSPRRTSIDKTNDCVMNSERGALVKGSDPPSGHSVHNTAGDTWRAQARRLIQEHLSTGVKKTDDQKISSLSDGKSRPFSGLGEERTTPRATSRLLDHGPT